MTTCLIRDSNKEIFHKDITIGDDGKDTIGSGAASSVYRATWKGINVAMKKYSISTLPVHLWSQFNMYCILSHANIVEFYGVCLEKKRFSVITELFPYNLRGFFIHYPLDDPLTYTIKLQIALDLASGLDYLHSLDYGHRYIKESNVFLDENFHAKLGNFRLDGLKMEASSNVGATPGSSTIRWRAPETFTRPYSLKKHIPKHFKRADVYSLGVILQQLYTREKPYSHYLREEEVVRIIDSEDLPIDKSWTFANIIENTLDRNPKLRPTTGQLIRLLLTRETRIYLVFLKTAPSVFQQGAMADVFPLIVKYIDLVLFENGAAEKK